MLELRAVAKSFGGVKALAGLDLDVRRGEILGLIGPNGSGKTTTINVVTGLMRPTSGRIRLDGVELGGRRPHEVVSLGIARTFQNLRLFGERSVRENLRVAQNVVCGSALDLFNVLPRAEERARHEEADDLLRRFSLHERRDELAGSLPYGDQKRLELARALATRPKLLLLDEPAAGMNPVAIDGLRDILVELRAGGLTMLLVEHHMRLVMEVCDRIAVLNFGGKISEGTPAEVSADPLVVEAYLGAG